jgi:hypothetical protein
MSSQNTIRALLARSLGWSDAHVAFDDAVAGLEPALRGIRPPGLPHSPWELLEHIRITQRDILEFCEREDYAEKSWPADYWPASPEPPSASAWEESIEAYRRDRSALQQLAERPAVDLESAIPHGDGQTYARELILTTDHTAYHVGQLVLVRQALGAWH